MTRAVVVRSASRRTIDDIEVFRPIHMPDSVVIFCMSTASAEAIVARVGGLLSDDENAAVADYLGIEPDGAA
jgi:hypothetical protein